MLVFYIMIGGIVLARLAGLILPALADWQGATRAGLALMFLFTSAAHFGSSRNDLIRMVPSGFPNPPLLVTLTGVAELAGAIGLVVPALARWAAFGLILLLVAMFPANVHASRTGHTIAGRPHTRMALRLPLQLLWIGLLWWSTLPA